MELTILMLELTKGKENVLQVHKAGCRDIARTNAKRMVGYSYDVEGDAPHYGLDENDRRAGADVHACVTGSKKIEVMDFDDEDD